MKKKDFLLQVRMTEDQLTMLDLVAEELKLDRSKAIRKLILNQFVSLTDANNYI